MWFGVSKLIRAAFTCVDKVVGIVVVAEGAGLGLVELGVFDFFELDHGGGCGGIGMGEEWRGWKGRVIVRYSSRWKPRCVLGTGY